MKYYDRKSKKIKDIKDQKALIFLYKTIIGRLILKVITLPIISKLSGLFFNSKLSKIYINKFIKKNNIKMNEYKEKQYKSFNDFFTRNVKNYKRNQKSKQKELISICDSKLMVYEISNSLTINVKNSKYTIESLIQKEVSKSYQKGKCLVFRLSVDDYHRYHSFDDLEIKETYKIKGKLHTVNPICYDKYKVFSENQREVGALNVGKIHNNQKTKLQRYEEKGYFSFGGSTIILLFKQNVIEIDKDILENSKKEIETKIFYGDVIGEKYER